MAAAAEEEEEESAGPGEASAFTFPSISSRGLFSPGTFTEEFIFSHLNTSYVKPVIVQPTVNYSRTLVFSRLERQEMHNTQQMEAVNCCENRICCEKTLKISPQVPPLTASPPMLEVLQTCFWSKFSNQT